MPEVFGEAALYYDAGQVSQLVEQLSTVAHLSEAQRSEQRERARALGEKLAVVVWQLPPRFKKRMDRLAGFVAALARWDSTRHAIEFRHPSWFDEEVAATLARHRIAACQSDAADWPLWEAVTTDLVYIRLHGHTRTYASAYSTALLTRWAARIRAWRGEGRAVHVYFDNDAEGAAPYDALRLMRLLKLHPATDPRAALGRLPSHARA